jgi:hypothetical protein
MSGAPLRVALPCPDRSSYLLSAAGRAARFVVLYTRSAYGLGCWVFGIVAGCCSG